MTEWRRIPFAPAYHVSEDGDVIRCKKSRGARVRHILKSWLDPKGYEMVHLRNNGRYIKKRIHAIVAEVFIGPCPDGHEVHHRDENKRNNHHSNLEYLSKSTHSKMGRNWSPIRGEDNHLAKLHEFDVHNIRDLHRIGLNFNQISKQYGISRGHIANIVRGISWSHI